MGTTELIIGLLALTVWLLERPEPDRREQNRPAVVPIPLRSRHRR